LPDELAAVAGSADDLFDRCALPGERQEHAVRLLATAITWRRPAQVSSFGSIAVAPIAERIVRVDLRMALRKAALAFHQVPTISDLDRAEGFASASP